jgi:2-oxoglutarate ferredoxin oxidoreductase subunit gamma
MYHDLFIAGTGGQGILLIGNIIAEAALAEGHEVTFLPSYGVEMRGGNASCTVVISDRAIGSPSVNTPQVLIAMSKRAQVLYEPKVLPGGLMVLNSSLVPASDVKRADFELMALPLNEIGAELGNARFANMIALGIYVGKTGAVKVEALTEGMEEALSERNRQYIPENMKAIEKGLEIAGNGGRV